MVNQSQFIEETKRWSTRSTIGGLVEVNIAKAGKMFEAESTIQYIDISSVDNATNTVLGATEYIFKDAPSRAQQCIKAGDFLVSTVRPNLKNIAVNHLSGDNLVASSGFCVLRPKDGYTGLLLAYILSDEFTEKMTLVAKGTNYPAVHDSDILDYEITVPEKDEVKRIDSLYRQADKSKFAGFKSQFIEMFGDPKNNPLGWAISSFGKEFEIASGGTPDTKNDAYWGGDISWIGSNLCQNTILENNDGKYITEKGLRSSSAKLFKPNYVLVALVGATIGKCAILAFETTTNQNIAGINVPGNKNYTSEFVFFAMQGLYKEFMLLGDGHFRMASLGFIRGLPLISPPISLQESFSVIVHQADKSKYLN